MKVEMATLNNCDTLATLKLHHAMPGARGGRETDAGGSGVPVGRE